jgi:hypothetical protein
VDGTTRALLCTIREACLRVGSANDLHDRGLPDDARELREDAQRQIAEALRAASDEDRDRVASLFGPDLPARCDQLRWSFVYDYLAWLLERDPELPVAALRARHSRFLETVGDLADAADAFEARRVVRFPPPRVPWMPNTFRRLLEHRGARLGSYRIPPWTYDLDLAGNGMRYEAHRSTPEPCDALSDGVLVQVELSRSAAHAGTAVTLRSRDREALERTVAELLAALRDDGWEELPG